MNEEVFWRVGETRSFLRKPKWLKFFYQMTRLEGNRQMGVEEVDGGYRYGYGSSTCGNG